MAKCKKCGATARWPAKHCPSCGNKMIYPGAGVVAVLLCLVVLFCAKHFTSLHSQVSQPIGNATGPVDASTPVETPSTTNISDNETPNSVLEAGTYTVGKDITAGTYDCIAVSGFGVLRGDVAAFGEPGFSQTMGESSVSVGGTSASVTGASSYSNLTLADGDVIYIEMNLKVEFVPK